MKASRLAREAAVGFGTGLVGTSAMSATTYLQTRIRASEDIPVDYDATGHVVTAASRVIGHRPETHKGRTALFLLVHWGYGSAMAIGHRALAARYPESRAATMFFVGCQSMAFVLFPVLGETPRPWKWRRDVLLSSVAQHLVYVGAVATADRCADAWLRRRRTPRTAAAATPAGADPRSR